LGISINNDSFSTFRMEENKKLITQSTKDTPQKIHKFNPIGPHLNGKANCFICKHATLYKKHGRQSKSGNSLQGQKCYKQNVKPNMDQKLNHIQIKQINDWNNEKTEKSKFPAQKKRGNDIYRWSINQLLNYVPPPKHIKKNLIPISNPDHKKRINFLLQLYQNKFYMRKHYCLTMTKIFEEAIQKMDEEMYFVHKIIKQTEGTTFGADRPNEKKHKHNRKIKRTCTMSQTTELKDQKTEEITSRVKQSKGEKQKSYRKLVKPIFKGYKELKNQEEIGINPSEDIIERPISPSIDPIEDTTNTLRFLGLSRSKSIFEKED